MLPYLSHKAHMQHVYGKALFSIPVNLEFGCPNREKDGSGGCSFCPEHGARAAQIADAKNVEEQIQKALSFAKRRYKADSFALYIQAYTGTFASLLKQKEAYEKLLSLYAFDAFHIGTRPDCLDAEIIELLESYKKRGLEVDIELGIESIYNETLQNLNRGCTHEDFISAMKLLENSSLDVCVHTILGLPGETREMIVKYADEINKFEKINFVKFHHLHIVKGSIMGVKYKREPFPLFTLEEYTDILCKILPKLRPDIVIQRLFALSDVEMLIAPKWGLKKSQIQNYIDAELERRNIIQGSEYRGKMSV